MKRRHLMLLILLLLAAAGRIAGAWFFRNNVNADCGIVALMVKHMVEGTGFPLFFYGQAYMGSVEPAVSALLCKLFGLSGFMICMGSAVPAFLTLLVVYAWTRDAAGHTAALAALAFCVLGPRVFFLFQVAPRGGYTVTLLLGTLVCWLSSRMAARERHDDRVSGWWFLLLGLLAGLGWWANQLIAYALGAAVLTLLVGFGRRVFTWRLLPGLLGFFAASAPLWLWNARNGWATFDFLNSPAKALFARGIRLLFTYRMLDFLDLAESGPWLIGTVVGLHLLLLAAAFAYLLSARRQPAGETGRLHLASAFFFLLVAALIFSKSHFATFKTARYLVPLVPPLAVLVGAGTAHLVRRLPWRLGWLPLVLVLAWQLRVLGELPLMTPRFGYWHTLANEIADGMRTRNLKHAHANYIFHWMNFALGEEFSFSELRGERYPPYAHAIEQADRFAIFGDYGGIRGLLAGTQTATETFGVQSFAVHYDFKPPVDGVVEIPPNAWKEVHDASHQQVTHALGDRALSTYWQSKAGPHEPEFLEVSFERPVEVSMVRLLHLNHRAYPSSYRILGQTGDGAEWEPLSEDLPFSAFYWSGPRPFWDGEGERLEARITPRRVRRLRIERTSNKREWSWRVAELQLFGPAAPGPTEEATLPELLERLETTGVRRLYCDRWVANKVLVATNGRVATPLEPHVYRQRAMTAGETLLFTPQTALLTRAENAAITRDALRRWDITMQETTVGPWALFSFPPDGWRAAYGEQSPLVWMGFAPFTGAVKEYAGHQLASLLAEVANGRPSRAQLDALLEAVALYPNYLTVLPDLAAWVAAHEGPEAGDALAAEYAALARPTHPARARFALGPVFLGITPSALEARPGETLTFNYFWRCPPRVRPTDWAVFVHFIGEQGRFQDDHVFLAQFNSEHIAHQPRPEIFRERSNITLPADLPPGRYRIVLGLYDRHSDTRLKPKTKLEVENRAIVLPEPLLVQE